MCALGYFVVEVSHNFQIGHAGATASQVIAGTSPLSGAKEFRSFATLNIAWLCVTKTVSSSAKILDQRLHKTGMIRFGE